MNQILNFKELVLKDMLWFMVVHLVPGAGVSLDYM